MTGYRPDIDGLRAFSIIAVVLYHAFPSLLPGGFVGVDVFFVISGYLITGIILRGQAEQSFGLGAFYRRRIQRIIPAVLVVLVFCLVAGWWLLLPYEYAMLGKQTGAATVFAPNILFWTEAGYFDTDSRLKPLLHLWSLGVEEQFYLLWPLLLIGIAKTAIKPVHWITALLLLSFVASVTIDAGPAAHFFLPHFRIWELLAGALLAAAAARPPSPAAGTLLAALGIGLLSAATLVIDRGKTFPGWWALLPVAGAALLIFPGPANPINRALGNRLLVYIGKISFPLYLWHWPLLTFLRIAEDGAPSPLLRVAAIAISIALAALSYRLVEKPLRYHPSPRVPAALVAALAMTGLAGMVVLQQDGFPDRTARLNPVIAPLQWKELGLHERDDCAHLYPVSGRCLSDGKMPTIAVLGDSHSTNTFFALAHAHAGSSEGVLRAGLGSCPPLYAVDIIDAGFDNSCAATIARNLDWLMAEKSVHTVYLSSMGPPYFRERQTRYTLQHTQDAASADNAGIFAAGLEDTTERLLAAGKRVVLVIDWPGLGFHPRQCVNTRPLRFTPFEARRCQTSRKRYNRVSTRYRETLTAIARRHPQVMLWDAAAAFCDDRACYGMREGQLLYRDPGHLSLAGSRYLGERLILRRASDLQRH